VIVYYLLMGKAIHGLPTENWNGIPNPKLGFYGYCHHGLDTFPIWHRPYMAFYEVYFLISLEINESDTPTVPNIPGDGAGS
jgi:hypothetical protein